MDGGSPTRRLKTPEALAWSDLPPVWEDFLRFHTSAESLQAVVEALPVEEAVAAEVAATEEAAAVEEGGGDAPAPAAEPAAGTVTPGGWGGRRGPRNARGAPDSA